MPKIKGWHRRVTNTSPSATDEINSHLIAKWVSIYGDEVSVGRTYEYEEYNTLEGEEKKKKHFLSPEDLEHFEDKDKWFVHKQGAAEPNEYFPTRAKAMEAARDTIKNLYSDSMVEKDLKERRRQRRKNF